jgi:hypothetical protein
MRRINKKKTEILISISVLLFGTGIFLLIMGVLSEIFAK